MTEIPDWTALHASSGCLDSAVRALHCTLPPQAVRHEVSAAMNRLVVERLSGAPPRSTNRRAPSGVTTSRSVDARA